MKNLVIRLGAWRNTLISLVGLGALLWLLPAIAPWATVFPDAGVLPISKWIGDAMNWLVKEADLGFATVQEITRGFAWVMDWPLSIANALLWKGLKLSKTSSILPLSWAGLLIAVTIVGYVLGRWRLAVLCGACFSYMVMFGLWKSSMMTLASIIVSVPLACFLGLLIGIAAHRSERAKRVIIVILDFMQTVPVFAYLLPVLFLFGFSPVSAMLATMIYAMPAMIRSTILGFGTTPSEIIEFGSITGATQRQMTWKILVPYSRPVLIVGINQVVVLSLNAVIIASLIGAGGLGFDVLKALRTLRIGQGLEAGVAIVLIAIMLDRISFAFSQIAQSRHDSHLTHQHSHRIYMLAAVGALALTTGASYFIDALRLFPKEWSLSTGSVVEMVVDYITIHLFDTIEALTAFLYIYVLNPFRDVLVGLPWVFVVAALGLLATKLSGWRLAVIICAMMTFIAISGFWEKAMITVYLIGISTIIASLIGIPLGVVASLNDRVSAILRVVCDTLQTLPSFVYLVPVVMLFRVGDVPALIAVVLYALAPAIRYTDVGLRRVDPSLLEGATAMGCTRLQTIWRVRIPMALPEILLGLNQTIMLAISMLVITALVGTRDLGQEVYIGLSRADTGHGLVAGICVAFLSIVSDRLIQAYASDRRKALGM
ncbi:MAG: ABC transporter permease subunit [Gammaproteobacteria bacterium]|nr:ABC transporter permease subunit [Gammaproteobacteria bacterium]MDH3464777.1 ABC transporter permease subunit [Gammaproteobacteria bacterium]